MGKGKVWLLFMMILLFLCGAAIFLHPYINGAVVDSTLKWEAQQFIDHITNPTNNSGDVAGEENWLNFRWACHVRFHSQQVTKVVVLKVILPLSDCTFMKTP